MTLILKDHQYNKVPEDYKQTTPESIHTEIEKKYEEDDKKLEDEMDNEYFTSITSQERLAEILGSLSQENVIDLVMGKKVNGIKLDKNQKRELKFAIKRDADSEEIYGILASVLGANLPSLKGGISTKKHIGINK